MGTQVFMNITSRKSIAPAVAPFFFLLSPSYRCLPADNTNLRATCPRQPRLLAVLPARAATLGSTMDGAAVKEIPGADVVGPRCTFEPLLNWRVFLSTNAILLLVAGVVVIAGLALRKTEDDREPLRAPAARGGAASAPSRASRKPGSGGKGKHRR